MKKDLFILSLIALACLTSCKKKESISLGSVEYYPGFLWSGPNMTPVTKTFEFDFSPDAKADGSFAEIQFVDNEGKPISTSVMQVIIDGKEIIDNHFKINSDVTSKEITFKFSPDAKEGKHQVSLKLIAHSLDRFGNNPLQPGQQIVAYPWTLDYEKRMNPLAKILMWFLIVVATGLSLWFFIFKHIMYPRIRLNRINISSSKGYFVDKRINGTRKVVITNKWSKQSFLNKLFTGEILLIVNDIWTFPLDLLPQGKKKSVKVNLHGKYLITPATTELQNFASYQIQNIETKELLTINIQ